MKQPTEALVRMVSPSPNVDEDKVSHGGETGSPYLPEPTLQTELSGAYLLSPVNQEENQPFKVLTCATEQAQSQGKQL